MKIKHIIQLSFVLIFCGLSSAHNVLAKSEVEPSIEVIDKIKTTQQSQFTKIKKININVKDIYDTQSNPEDALWFQNFANTYHIKTKDSVILGHLSVKVGEQVSEKDLREAERLLRKQSYLRDAVVHLTDDGLLIVDVVENWTMFPTLSFKRTGRQNSSSIGVRDTNLLGYGIASTFSYKKDAHKSGYRMRLQAPTEWIDEHSITRLILEDYDIGQQQSFVFEKPFYGLASKDMYHISAFNSEIESTFDHNGEQVGLAETKSRSINLIYGTSDGVINNTNNRLLSGIVHYDLDLLSYDSGPTADLFNLRKQDYVWIGRERFDDEYSVQKNIHIMSNKEDINLGLIDEVKLGIGSTQIALTNEVGMTIEIIDTSFIKLIYDASFGHSINNLLVLQSLNMVADLYKNDAIKDYQTLNYDIEFFYHLSDKYTLYNNTSLSYTSEFRGLPLGIGGDTGLRGYPTQYQYGRKRWLSNMELRYYSDYELWDSLAFGLAAFVDIGRAWDNPSLPNIESKALASMGIGLRIFPKISSGRNVVHIDLARPFSSNADFANWAWRIQVRNSF